MKIIERVKDYIKYKKNIGAMKRYTKRQEEVMTNECFDEKTKRELLALCAMHYLYHRHNAMMYKVKYHHKKG